MEIRLGTEVTNVRFEIKGEKKRQEPLSVGSRGEKQEIPLTEDDLVFITNGSCTEGTIYGDQDHAPVGNAEVREKWLLESLEEYCSTGFCLWPSREILF